MESNEVKLESNSSTEVPPPTPSAAPPQPHVSPEEKDYDEPKQLDEQREHEEKEPDQEPETCACVPAGTLASTDSQPHAYQHLGAAPSVQDLRRCLEARLGLPSVALRIETVAPSEREGATERGCPAAKWVLRRSGEQEKFLAIVRVRPGHACATAVIVVALVSWEGIPRTLADQAFDYLASELPQRGMTIERRCAANESRTCGCQGFDEATCGASYSFGCSWSMFHNACKFARTREQARKFRLRLPETETELAAKLNCLADVAGRVLETAAPDAFQAQVRDSILATDCRLGSDTPPEKRPFSGVTACLDFCMHTHKDSFALDGGCNVVVTLADGRSSDEQLHVLPGYMPAKVDEFDSETGQSERISRGYIQSLRHVSLVTRVRGTPLAPCAIRKKVKKTTQQQQQQIQAQQKPQQLAQKHLQHQKSGRAATAKEEHSPASIDSGFESIKSNRSPDKDEQQHQSPPMAAPAASTGFLPPIASWFRKSATQWIPPQQQVQRQHSLQHQHAHLMPLAPPSAPPTQLGQQPLPSLQMPQSAPGYPDARGVGSDNPLQQQHFAQQMQQQTNGNRQDLRQPFTPQCSGSEFTHPHPPPPPSQSLPQQQQQLHAGAPQYHQQSYQQMGARPMPQYPPQQHQYPGYMPRYPMDHPVHQYPGGYPGTHWRPQHPNGSYYGQHPQYRGQPPPNYRQYPYPAYPQQSMQHPGYEIDYPNHQQYYSQHLHQQQHQQLYSQYYPQYPGQNQHQQSQSLLQLQQQPPNNNYQLPHYPNQPPIEQSQQLNQQQPLQQQQQRKQQQPSPAQQQPQQLQQQSSTQASKRRSSESASSETSKGSPGDREFLSDSAELFRDERMGGLAIALTHGSVLIEAAKHDSHATTALRRPNRNHPSNLSLVFFQHKSLSYAHHGYSEYAEKMRLLRLRRAESSEAKADAAAARPLKIEDK